MLGPGPYRRFQRGFALRRVDVRPWVLPVPMQEIPTADGLTVKVSVVGRARVIDPAALPDTGKVVFGATVKSFDPAPAKAVKGVVDVVQISRGVAVVADSVWAAMKGREVLSVVWDEGAHKGFSSDGFVAQLRTALNGEAFTTRKEGDVERALTEGLTKLEAVYEYPHQAHAPLETMNCVADVRPDFDRLRRVQTRGVIVTGRSPSADFVSNVDRQMLPSNWSSAVSMPICTMATLKNETLLSCGTRVSG